MVTLVALMFLQTYEVHVLLLLSAKYKYVLMHLKRKAMHLKFQRQKHCKFTQTLWSLFQYVLRTDQGLVTSSKMQIECLPGKKKFE